MADGTTSELWVVVVREEGTIYFDGRTACSAEEAIAASNKAVGGNGHEDVVGAFPRAFGQAGGWAPSLPRPKFDTVSVQMVEAWAREQAKHAPGPRKPAPQLPPEIWNPNKVDAGRAWAAVVAMCGGTR